MHHLRSQMGICHVIHRIRELDRALDYLDLFDQLELQECILLWQQWVVCFQMFQARVDRMAQFEDLEVIQDVQLSMQSAQSTHIPLDSIDRHDFPIFPIQWKKPAQMTAMHMAGLCIGVLVTTQTRYKGRLPCKGLVHTFVLLIAGCN